jgi:hypothetical protein
MSPRRRCNLISCQVVSESGASVSPSQRRNRRTPQPSSDKGSHNRGRSGPVSALTLTTRTSAEP